MRYLRERIIAGIESICPVGNNLANKVFPAADEGIHRLFRNTSLPCDSID